MDDKDAWLARNNAELVEGWREAWWIEARAHVKSDREQRRLIDETDPVRFAVLHLVDHDPARALEVGFLIARTADHMGMLINVGVCILQELLKDDLTLWDAITLEAAANPKLLKAIGQIWEVAVPEPLWDAYHELDRPQDEQPPPPEDRPSGR
jgi:nucleoside 2-deoxyribosyltransferase